MFWKNMSKDVKEKYFALAREVDKEHKRKYPGTSSRKNDFSLSLHRLHLRAESKICDLRFARLARDRILGTRRGVAASRRCGGAAVRRRGAESRSRAAREPLAAAGRLN